MHPLLIRFALAAIAWLAMSLVVGLIYYYPYTNAGFRIRGNVLEFIGLFSLCYLAAWFVDVNLLRSEARKAPLKGPDSIP